MARVLEHFEEAKTLFNEDRIVGIFVTHGHDNQIGAITDILNDIPDIKIYYL